MLPFLPGCQATSWASGSCLSEHIVYTTLNLHLIYLCLSARLIGNMFQTMTLDPLSPFCTFRPPLMGLIPNPMETFLIPGNTVFKMMRLAASDEIMSEQRADRFDPSTEAGNSCVTDRCSCRPHGNVSQARREALRRKCGVSPPEELLLRRRRAWD